jgi:hypothetical protein
VREIDQTLPGTVEVAYPVDGLEQKLTYTMACIQENFRINPVFTMPLTRKVTAQSGMTIDGYYVPNGVSLLFRSGKGLMMLTFGTGNSFQFQSRHAPQSRHLGSNARRLRPEQILGSERRILQAKLGTIQQGPQNVHRPEYGHDQYSQGCYYGREVLPA